MKDLYRFLPVFFFVAMSMAAEPATQPVDVMEQLSTPSAVHAALGDAAFTLFTEDRAHSIRRLDAVPQQWLARPAEQRAAFHAHAQPGEDYFFQLGLVAGPKEVGPITFSTAGLISAKGTIDATLIHCINLEGVNPDGQPLRKLVTVAADHVQPLWIAVHVPANALGTYTGEMKISAGESTATASITLDVSGDVLNDGGIGDPSRLARLKWLDSTVGSEEIVTKPFIPVTQKADLISILGRDVQLNSAGLPAQITTHFSPSNTQILPQGQPLLAGPISFNIDLGKGSITLTASPLKQQLSETNFAWSVTNQAENVFYTAIGKLEFDGMLSLDLQLHAMGTRNFKQISFDVPIRKQFAKYLMGLGYKGGLRPDDVHWQWNADNFQDAVWLGNVNGGIQFRFKGENYRRPLVNIYYPFRKLMAPESWGSGGIDITSDSDTVHLHAYTGPLQLQAETPLHFKVEMLLTPFKPIDTDRHWADRFLHPFEGSGQKVIDHALTELKPGGPNIIELHHATYTNPYINYPFNSDSLPVLQKFVAQVHDEKARAMVYYTTRELTINLPEIWALNSLNGEVIFPGPGPAARTVVNPKGPHPWLVEHLGDSFIPAWRATIGSPYNKLDLSVITTPDSRWNNFYLEGLKFLCDRAGIDGIYVDDTALDHRSLQRARRILDSSPGRLIDLHSWNHNNIEAHRSNSAIVYMELFPYIDRLWLGEGFAANKVSPDYWLIEMSGIPFGLTADMLQDGGNVWLGMLYGETPRLGWTKGDPRPMWKLWDAFGMTGSEMIGYWDDACPVHTDDPNVLATVYRRQDRTLIALGNFGSTPASVHLTIDRKALNLPEGILQMQSQLTDQPIAPVYSPGDKLDIQPKGGMLLIVTAKPG